jgi:hypothetical protein
MLRVSSGVRRLPMPKPTTAAVPPERSPTAKTARRNAMLSM